MTTQEIIEVIKGLSVLELNELVKACEEEFGVSAAAGVVVAQGPAGGAAEEEKTEFDVELTEIGPNKVKVIKAVKSYFWRKGQRGKRYFTEGSSWRIRHCSGCKGIYKREWR